MEGVEQEPEQELGSKPGMDLLLVGIRVAILSKEHGPQRAQVE